MSESIDPEYVKGDPQRALDFLTLSHVFFNYEEDMFDAPPITSEMIEKAYESVVVESKYVSCTDVFRRLHAWGELSREDVERVEALMCYGYSGGKWKGVDEWGVVGDDFWSWMLMTNRISEMDLYTLMRGRGLGVLLI